MDIIKDIPDYDGIGIYAIVDNTNGKMYIGKSTNVKERLLWHSKHIPEGKDVKKLCEAYREGHDFTAKLIETLKYGIHQLFLSERETFYIKKFDSVRNGYNTYYRAFVYTEKEFLERLSSLDKDSDYYQALYREYQRRTKPILKKRKKLQQNIHLKILTEKYDEIRAAAEKPCLISRFVCVRACHRYRKKRVQRYIIPLGSSTDIYERKQGCRFACKPFLLSESNFTTCENNAHSGAQAIIQMYHFRDI